MVVLGIDPGTANTGYGVVHAQGGRTRAVDAGVIVTSPGAARELRLSDIHRRIGELIEAHAPEALALEEQYFGRNVGSASAVGQAVGVILLAAGQRGVPCHSYTPQQVKSAVCGSGRADKDQVGQMVKALLGLDAVPRADHAADALAIAICHSAHAPLASRLSAAGVSA